MTVLLAVAWVISPLILIPLLISRSAKLKKYKLFVDQLFAQGRIDRYELMTLVAAMRGEPVQPNRQMQGAEGYRPEQGRRSVLIGPPVAPKPSDLYGPPVPDRLRNDGVQRVAAQRAVPPAPQTAPQSAPVPPFPQRPQNAPVQNVPPQAYQPAAAQTAGAAQQPAYVPVRPVQSVQPPKPKKERNPASVLLGIGAALVILAGMVFSKAAWLDMNNWGRVGVIALMSLFFFGCCAFAHKKLKLRNTSMAFYLLGSVFVGVTFVTMGYFGLVGEWLSVSGDGFWLLYSLATLLITLFLAHAAKLYKMGGFVHAALYSGLVSFTLMSVQVIEDRRWWAFALNVIAAVPIYLLYSENTKFAKEKGDPLRIFTVVTASVYAMTALPFMMVDLAGRWELPELLTALVWFAQAMYYGSVLDNIYLKAAHAVGRIIIIAEMTCMIVDTGANDRTMMFAFIMFVMALVWRYIPVIRSGFSDWGDILALFTALIVYRTNDKFTSFLCDMAIALMLTALFTVHTFGRKESAASKIAKHLLPLSALLSAWTVSAAIVKSLDYPDTQSRVLGALLPMMLISFAMSFAFANVGRLRTAVSDAVFPVSLFSCGLAALMAGGTKGYIISACAFLLTAVLMLMLSQNGNTMAKVMKHLLIVPFTAFALSMSAVPDLSAVSEISRELSMLIFAGIIFVMALGFRFAGLLGADIRTVVSDFGFTILIFLTGLGLIDSECMAAAPFLMSGIAALTFIFEYKPKRRRQILLMRLFFPVTICFAAGSLFGNLDLAIGSAIGQILYITFALAVILIGFDRVHRLRTRFSDFLLPIMAFGSVMYRCALLESESYSELFTALLATLLLTAMLVWQGCQKNEGRHLIVHRIAAPFTLLMSVSFLDDIFRITHSYSESMSLSMLTASVVVLIAAAAFTCLAKHSEDFKGYAHSQYAWSLAAGLFMQWSLTDKYSSAALLAAVCVMAMAVGLYILCQNQNNVLISIFPIAAFLRSGVSLGSYISADTGANYDLVILIITCCMAAVLACGRLLYREQLYPSGEKGRLRLDTASLGIMITPFMALSCASGVNERAVYSISLMLAAAFFGNFIRSGHTDKTNRVMMTIASGLLCCLVYTRPFLISDEAAVNAKINLLPMLAFGVIVRFIWRENESFASRLTFAAHVSAFGFLLLDALMNQSLANTLFVLITTLIILLVSFAKKNGKWFAVSGSAFLGLTLYITQSFFGRAEWWVYLLVAGIILIVVAAVNEYLKSNGTSIKNEAERFKNRWEK
ncbi:hypothetical protein SAMN02910447_02222 [Ruminococcus sp. YE71]|uniref:hypothetical protein n=1 Tax=unclassified Ruminococcus TaxID=2608920 RepID=UPI00088F7181|nr:MULTISPECIES: hypothetical protein [unclassified Ruminococcus]SDA22782.1 hypothetical protein SAMN02910446_02090 [Ruminococcus sp. YE78]SFW38788.1 hypothetical protein SAMN02910447_02222 [Ruminococcus sp. YE71]